MRFPAIFLIISFTVGLTNAAWAEPTEGEILRPKAIQFLGEKAAYRRLITRNVATVEQAKGECSGNPCVHLTFGFSGIIADLNDTRTPTIQPGPTSPDESYSGAWTTSFIFDSDPAKTAATSALLATCHQYLIEKFREKNTYRLEILQKSKDNETQSCSLSN